MTRGKKNRSGSGKNDITFRMTITTKYETGQHIFFKKDGEHRDGVIGGFRYTNGKVVYEVDCGEWVGALVSEDEVSLVEPEGFKRIAEAVAMFPEFGDMAKMELEGTIRKLLRQSEKKAHDAVTA